MVKLSESHVEAATLAWLAELGYSTAHGPKGDRVTKGDSEGRQGQKGDRVLSFARPSFDFGTLT
jgi:hypothetical protein